MQIRKTQQSLVFITNAWAYKVYTRRGAQQMRSWELEGQSAALKTNAWRNHVVVARPAMPYCLVMPSGLSVTDRDLEIATKFVDEITLNALVCIDWLPLSTLINVENFGRIDHNLRALAGERLLNDRLRRLKLPTGPSHGDLHRDNLISVQGKLMAIDFGRFRVHSCPLFDCLHFRLSEAQRIIDSRWLEMLFNHKELVSGVAMEYNVDPLSLLLGYSLHRISQESAVAFVRKRSMSKFDKQLEQIFVRTGGLRAF